MAIEADDPRLLFLPFDQIEKGTGVCNVIRNSWWSVHPEKGLIFWKRYVQDDIQRASPQCNSVKEIADQVAGKLYPWAEIRQIPLVIY